MPDGGRESLEVPARVRREVMERDRSHCRLCGRFDDNVCLHHVLYGGDAVGMGGRRKHDPDSIISLGWSPWHDCHRIVHADKRLWQPLALQIVSRPGLTMLQLRRWEERRTS